MFLHVLFHIEKSKSNFQQNYGKFHYTNNQLSLQKPFNSCVQILSHLRICSYVLNAITMKTVKSNIVTGRNHKKASIEQGMNQEYNETKKNSTKTSYILCKTYLAISLQKTMKLLLGNQKPLFNCSII